VEINETIVGGVKHGAKQGMEQGMEQVKQEW